MVRAVNLSCQGPLYAEIIKDIDARRGEVLGQIFKNDSAPVLNVL